MDKILKFNFYSPEENSNFLIDGLCSIEINKVL